MSRLATKDDPPLPGIWGPTIRAMLPWYLLLVVGKLVLIWPPFEEEASFVRWLWMFAHDTALILPFLLFAAGVALARTLGYSRRVLRAGAVVGISVVAVSYGLGAWLAPALDDRYLANVGAETEDMREFGPQTPVGILRNIRFVEASPPAEYSLRASTPRQFPPNVLRWDLHVPIAFAAFGLINLLIGVRSAELTADMTRGSRRNTRVAIGVLGGMAFFAFQMLVGPVESFLRDGTMRSGVAAAWIPLALPAAEALLFTFLVRSRRYG